MAADTVAFTGLSDKYIGLGIATIAVAIVAGVALQRTRRFRKMPAFFVATFPSLKSKNYFKSEQSPILPIVLTVLYYILLATPLILLVTWVGILARWHQSNPPAIIFFIGVFVILLFLPSQSKFFYFKILALFITFLLTQFLLVGLNWVDKYVSFYLEIP